VLPERRRGADAVAQEDLPQGTGVGEV